MFFPEEVKQELKVDDSNKTSLYSPQRMAFIMKNNHKKRKSLG